MVGSEGQPLVTPASCDASEISASLAAASAGDVVQIGACEVSGTFLVPDGVTLRGQGPGNTTIDTTAIGVVLVTGAEGAAVSDLTIDADGTFGILARETGSASISNVTINATRGVAIGAQNLGSIDLEQVSVTGPVTPDNDDTFPGEATAFEVAAHGIVLVDVADANLTDVHAWGFTVFGVLSIRTGLTWDHGSAGHNISAGLVAHGGTADLSHVALVSQLFGYHPDHSAPVGAGFSGGVVVTTSHVHANLNEGWGLFHDGAGSTVHADLFANDNAHAGLWYQGGEDITIDGAHLQRDSFAGVVVLDSVSAAISDAHPFHTVWTTAVGGTAGDGIQIVNTPATISDSLLFGNYRVGLAVELAGLSLSDLSVDGVMVHGTGSELGAIVQKDGTPYLVTDGIRRLGATGSNDASMVASLDTLDLIAAAPTPCFLPQAAPAVTGGLLALFGQIQPPNP